MQTYQKPSKEEVREWLRELVESDKPPPAPELIANQLWHHADNQRQQVLS